jgi:hypothetical protein
MRTCLKDKIVIDKVGNFIIVHRKGDMDVTGVAKRREGDPEDDEMGTLLALARYFNMTSNVSFFCMNGIIDIITKPQDYILVTNQDKREKLYKKHVLEEHYKNENSLFYINTKKYIFVEDLIFKINRNRIK